MSVTKENYGKSMSYTAIHQWLIYHHGVGEKCSRCGAVGKKDGQRWSLEHALKPSYVHAKDIAHYDLLCKKCHRSQDIDQEMLANMRKGWVERKTKYGLVPTNKNG